jgi:transcriptional regulator with XRE-family HTH domain
MESISRRLKAIRKELLVTQYELAELMGLTQPTICTLETKKAVGISQGTLKKIRNFEQKLLLTGTAATMRVPR